MVGINMKDRDGTFRVGSTEVSNDDIYLAQKNA